MGKISNTNLYFNFTTQLFNNYALLCNYDMIVNSKMDFLFVLGFSSLF